MPLILASRNEKKCRELQAILGETGPRVVPVTAYPQVGEIEETGRTFEENAILKAETVCRMTGQPALADDSGLVVDALDGAPGIYSARFSGPQGTDASNIELLLKRMEGVPDEDRSARFVCVIAFAQPGQPVLTVRGQSEGRILHALDGEGGFGYDPVFYSSDLGICFARAAPDEKNAVSHRGRALRSLLESYGDQLGTYSEEPE